MRYPLLALFLAALLTACDHSPQPAPPSSKPQDSTPPAAQPLPTPAAPAAQAALPAMPTNQVTPPANPSLLALLVDKVIPGDEPSEQNHNQKGEATQTGTWAGRVYRDANDGWFSWDMKVIPDQTTDLLVTYAGVDKRTFLVLIDGAPLNNQIQPGSPEDFYDQRFSIPASMTAGKSTVTIRFQSIDNGPAGGVFGLRTLRAAALPAPLPAPATGPNAP